MNETGHTNGQGLLALLGRAVCVGVLAVGCGNAPETAESPPVESETESSAGPMAAMTPPKEAVPEEAPAALRSPLLHVNRDDSTSNAQRLTQVRFQQQHQRTQPPLRLDIPPHGPEEIPEKARSCLSLPVSLRAEDYTSFRVTMRTNKGTSCKLTWRSDIEPDPGKNPGISWPIFADNELHTYTVHLESSNVNVPDTWAGQVSCLLFAPSDEPAHVTIESMELLYFPPKGPSRVTVMRETCEALMGTQAPWTLTVPPSAVLETRLGLYPRSYKECNSDGFGFRIHIEMADGTRKTIWEKVYDADTMKGLYWQWELVRLNLSTHAGQKVRIHLEVDNLATSAGDYAFWGNPMVFSSTPKDESTPVILISCDTLRADHLSCYGYDRPTSPHIDQFADDAVLFENAITQWGYTLPAHITMLTGLYPKNHAVTTSYSALAEERVTLAEALRDHGYMTGAFVATSWFMSPCFGFPQGFDVYSGGSPYRDVFTVHNAAKRWLEEHPTDRFFLFLHNFDIHSKPANGDDSLPYTPVKPEFFGFAKSFEPAPTFVREQQTRLHASDLLAAANDGRFSFSQPEVDYMVALYDDSIRVVDSAIGEFFDYLKRRELYDKALIIITADHGEEFGEHGKFLHGSSFEHTARVPLIVKFPHGKMAGRRVSVPVELADIYPTVLDGLPQLEQREADGQSLLAVLAGGAGPQTLAHTRHHHDQAVRRKDWKLRRETTTGALSLFNLAQDPMEQVDLYDESLPVVAELKDELSRFFGAYEEGWHIALRGGTKDAQFNLELTTNAEFESVELMAGESHDAVSMSDDPRVAGGTLAVAAPDTDEVVFRTASPSSSVFLRVSSPAQFEATVGDGAPVTTNQFSAKLSPETDGLASGPRPSSSVLPSLHVWRVSRSSENGVPSQLSPDTVEQLESLGYID